MASGRVSMNRVRDERAPPLNPQNGGRKKEEDSATEIQTDKLVHQKGCKLTAILLQTVILKNTCLFGRVPPRSVFCLPVTI